MTSRTSIALAAMTHLGGAVSLFIEMPKTRCSPGPSVAGVLFLIAILDLVYDSSIFPYRYRHISSFWIILTEYIMTMFILEFGSLIVWCSIERCIYIGLKSLSLLMGMPIGRFNQWDSVAVGLVTIPLSMLILFWTLQATKDLDYLQRKLEASSYKERVLGYLQQRLYPLMELVYPCGNVVQFGSDEDDDDT